MDNQDKYEESTQANEGSSTGGKTFKESKPDEIKERVKETVQKGVAAVAGALKGFSEEAKKDDLGRSTKQAIQKAGETTREVAGTVKSEYRETKTTIKGEGAGAGGMGYGGMGDVGAMGGTSANLGAKDVPDLRKTDLSKTDEELDKE